MSFKGGIKEAAKMLAGLDLEAQQRVLLNIAKRNPAMAQALKSNLIGLEDLKFLTTAMLQDLLKEFSHERLALALRMAESSVSQHILSMLPSRLKADMQDILQGPARQKSEVQKEVSDLFVVIRKLINEGKIILKDQSEEYV